MVRYKSLTRTFNFFSTTSHKFFPDVNLLKHVNYLKCLYVIFKISHSGAGNSHKAKEIQFEGEV